MAIAVAAALLCHRQSGRTACRPQAKLARTNLYPCTCNQTGWYSPWEACIPQFTVTKAVFDIGLFYQLNCI